MLATPDGYLCSGVYEKDQIQVLQRLAVRNSLNVAKLKMMKDKMGDMVLVIDQENSLPMCPAFDIRPKP